MRKQKKIKIGDRKVGDGETCFIIAEAGVNHNGDLQSAKKLVDAAKAAGADAIKFQTFKTEGVVVDNAPMAEYQQKNTGKKSSQKEMLKKLELKYEDFRDLAAYCDRKGIIFLSTPHSFDAIDFLDPLVPAYKFGSGDLTNIPALEYAAKKGKPIIIGTGMSNLAEVKTAVDAIKRQGNKEVIALHCTTSYPCKLEEVNLRAMLTLRKELNCLVGYSDHTPGIEVPIMAATLGALMIEKHFTLDKKLPGPDHKASLNPTELKEMIKGVRDVEKILGSEEKKPTRSEKKIMALVRKSVVAAENIPQGTKIVDGMLAIKRPGTGIAPKEIRKIIGKTAKRHIKKDELIGWHML